MSGEALYERYKDALKRGHVASLRGRLEEALTAYAEAAAIAPERATPHTSAATALMRRKRPGDALRHYTAALALSPRDEASMLGRAQALAALNRRPEAAEAYDRLAELRATNGKLADAVDAARRALELAEGRERRRTLERLIDRLRTSSPGEPGRVAMEKALLVLDGAAVAEATTKLTPAVVAVESTVVDPPHAVAEPTPEPGDADLTAEPLSIAVVAHVADEAADEVDAGDVVAEASDEADRAGVAVDADPAAGPDDQAEDAGEPQPVRAALDRDLPDELDVAALAARADDAVVARDAETALPLLLDLAAAYRREGRTDAALDACYVALSLEPDDIGLHLGLVELYDDRGWNVLAVEKLDLLDRLVALDEGAGADRVLAAREARS
jgi:tetratricopeptide (TPR) repeat protein